MNNLAKIRGKHCMTQEELARHLGVTKAGVCAMEKRHITLRQAQKCAKVFGVSVFEILGDDVFTFKPTKTEDKEYVCALLTKK